MAQKTLKLHFEEFFNTLHAACKARKRKDLRNRNQGPLLFQKVKFPRRKPVGLRTAVIGARVSAKGHIPTDRRG